MHHHHRAITGIFFLLMAVISCQLPRQSQDNSNSLIAKNAQPRLVSDQFSFTEGPAADKQGNIFFTDQPNNTIWRYGTEGELTLFMENAGRANGLYFDQDGNLLACADGQNQLWSISPEGEVTVLLKEHQGARFNGPNDLWVAPDGGIYFTDPYYHRSYWERESPELESQNVYYFQKGENKAVAVAESLKKPNGIIGTPDGKYLYVADIGDKKTYRYSIKPNGELKDRQLFTEQGSDGMTMDEQGNIYLTGKGVMVFNPEGKKIEHIAIPEPWTANVTFGGKDRKTLFITASESIYVLPMQVKGAH